MSLLSKHVIKYCEKVYERFSKNLFKVYKNSGEILYILKARDFNATSFSKYHFSTLYTTSPLNLIKDKLIDIIEGSPYLECNARNAFFYCRNMSCIVVSKFMSCSHCFVGQYFIQFGTKFYRQVVGILVDTSCAPLVADLFLFLS